MGIEYTKKINKIIGICMIIIAVFIYALFFSGSLKKGDLLDTIPVVMVTLYLIIFFIIKSKDKYVNTLKVFNFIFVTIIFSYSTIVAVEAGDAGI